MSVVASLCMDEEKLEDGTWLICAPNLPSPATGATYEEAYWEATRLLAEQKT